MADNDWVKILPEDTMTEEWDFQKNDTLEGVFVEKREGVGANKSNIYEFELADGKRVGVWGSTVLDTRFRSLKVGEEVRVVYLGKETSEKTKRQYHNFDVFHKPLTE